MVAVSDSSNNNNNNNNTYIATKLACYTHGILYDDTNEEQPSQLLVGVGAT